MAYDYSRADWDGLCDHLRDVPWEDIFKLSASAAASEFCEWVQVGIDVYLPPSFIVWSNGLVVKALDSQSRGPVFKTTGWLQGQLSLSSSRGR